MTGRQTAFGFTAFLNWLDEALAEPFQISHVIMLKAQQRELRTSRWQRCTGNQAFQQLSSVGLAPNTMSNMEDTGGGSLRSGTRWLTHGRGGDRCRFSVRRREGESCWHDYPRAGIENIANQTRDVVISDTYLWARLATEAVKVLDITS